MTLEITRRRALAAAAGLCGLIASTLAFSTLTIVPLAYAQTSQLDDLVGFWASKKVNGPVTDYLVYQVTTSPGTLTLRYVRTDVVTTLPGVSGDTYAILYELTVTDRALSGTVTADTHALQDVGCPFEQRTFPVHGRISPDWTTITIIENHEVPTVNPCGWQNFGETVVELQRYH